MGKIIRMTLEEAKARFEIEKTTPDYKARMQRLRAMRDEDIDFSDQPEITDEAIARGDYKLVSRGGVRIGAGRKPAGRVPMTLRLRPQIARRLRALSRKNGKTISAIAEERLAGV